MKEINKSRVLFAVTDLLSSVLLWGGLIITAYGLFAGFTIQAIWSASVAGLGLSLLIVTHVGRALICIAETNSQILQKLSE